MTPRLLLVEDNPDNMRLLRDWLETENFAVDEAIDLSEARESIERKVPDAVLLDVRVGAEDGLDLARWIRTDARFCQLPIIAVTAHALPREHENILAEGCNAIVSKPIDFRQLFRVLNLWLEIGRRRAAQRAHAQ
jgi:two-component system sensor histidine kinase/response regulator